KAAVDAVQQSIQRLKDEGGDVLYGGERLEGEKFQGGCYMKPCLATAKPGFEIVQHETFGPLLYLMTYRDFDEAMSIHNNVPQGLTSSIFTNDAREAERFMSASGSDCGIANVNTGTSGAEIGGAFGGEKQTGGGRESGSEDRKSTRLNSSHDQISYAVFCLKKKKKNTIRDRLRIFLRTRKPLLIYNRLAPGANSLSVLTRYL